MQGDHGGRYHRSDQGRNSENRNRRHRDHRSAPRVEPGALEGAGGADPRGVPCRRLQRVPLNLAGDSGRLARWAQHLAKLYGPADGNQQERRYSAGHCCGTITGAVSGDPDPAHVSTSFVERQNLSLRMGNRRFTRLTNGFSKKVQNHEYALAIYYMHYNFGRIHKSLRVTPAMEAKVSDHVWSLDEIAELAA